MHAEDIIDRKYNIRKDQNLMSPRVAKLVEGVFNEKRVNRWEGQFDIGISADLFGISTAKRKQIDIDTLGYPILDNSGQLKYVVFHTHDITERKIAEATIIASLREKESLLREIQLNRNRFKDIVELLPGAIIEMDTALNVTYSNQAGFKLFGYTEQDLKAGINGLELLHPDDREKGIQRTANHFEGKYVPPTEYMVLKKDGSAVPVFYNAIPILQEGEIKGFRASITDISRLKDAEEKLRDNEALLSAFTSAIPDISFIYDEDGTYVKVFATRNDLLADKPELMEGKKTHDVLPNEIANDILKVIHKTIKTNQSQDIEYKLDLEAGEKWFRARTSKMKMDIDGKKIIVWIANDITKRKKAEEQIKASLKEKDTLLHEIHHRVKNNFTVVSSLLKLQANSMEDERLKAALSDSRSRVQAMSDIHEVLYTSERLSALDMNSYLTKLTRDALQNYTLGTKVNFKIEAELILVGTRQASPIGLIVNELITNSLKYAFPDTKEGEIKINLQKTEDQIELIFMDNGIGIPDNFDWYNTKSMGLNLVKILAENQLGGSIDMESNNGTKFTIKFNIEA